MSHPEPAVSPKQSQCIVCSAQGVSTLFHQARDYVTGDFFDVQICSTCEVAWTEPIPVNSDKYYPNYYRRYNPLVIATLTYFYKRRVAKWVKHFKQVGSALEIGCGAGFMLDALRRFGWQVAGTERTDAMADFARNQLGIEVFVDGSHPLPASRRFDLIIMFHVLEHLADPVRCLRQAAETLNPGGAIVVAVPNLGSLQARFGKALWVYLDVPRHLVHFTPTSIAATAQAAGLSVKNISFASFEHDPYGWVQSILNRWFGNRNRLMSLLMRATPWRFGDILTAMIAILITPLAIVLSMITWGFRSGGVMEVTLSREG
jgi:SAM-dependent methyltransferase